MENIVDSAVLSMRNQLMVSSTTIGNHSRLAHFIEPSFPFNELPPNIPPHAFTSNLNSLNEPNMLKPNFIGWQTTCEKWQQWILRMRPHHGSTWKTTGIYDAIISSVFDISQDNNLVLALSKKWFPDTNTFVFNKQEYSVTLEDVCVLGGYSVLGESVLDPIDTNTQVIIKEVDIRLKAARRVLNHSSAMKVTYNGCIDLFNTPNLHNFNDIEHEAFLVFWLSKFVFPKKEYVIGDHVHSLAIRLARGTRIALAPAILASLYRDLRSLKNALFARSPNLVICSPMHLVQVWAWERFPNLAKPNITVRGHQIMARWEDVIPNVIINIENFLETCGFCFRPYAKFHKFHAMTRNMYPENGVWVFNFSDLDIQSFLKFVRPSELLGLDSIELYLPNQVARQFGFDQDIPGQVVRFNENANIAWEHYMRPFTETCLYVPSKLAQTEVTFRYLVWWYRSSFQEAGPSTRR